MLSGAKHPCPELERGSFGLRAQDDEIASAAFPTLVFRALLPSPLPSPLGGEGRVRGGHGFPRSGSKGWWA